MKKRLIVIASVLVFSVANSAISSEYVCESASSLHEKKMNKYKIPSFPMLLKDCGLDNLLGSFGIDLFDFNLGNLGALCGYDAQNVADWYEVPTSGSGSTSVNIDLDVVEDGSQLFGDEPLFEVSK
jgi:hypothetical protein